MRTLREVSFSIAVLSFALVGCSPDCVAVCEETKDNCDEFDVNCQETCDDLQYIAEEESCEEELDEWVACIDDSDKDCDAFKEDCGDEGDHVEECVKDYCEGKEGSKRCVDNVFME